MSDEFTQKKFAWIGRVAADAGLPSPAHRVAIAILQHLSPGISIMLADTGDDRRRAWRHRSRCRQGDCCASRSWPSERHTAREAPIGRLHSGPRKRERAGRLPYFQIGTNVPI
jgi:hypothetical protein